MVAQQKTADLLDKINDAYQIIQQDQDFVVIEGITNQRALNVFDMAINEMVASKLETPVFARRPGEQQ